MNSERVAVRTYRALTRLYPRRFRDEYRADMVALFREQCRDEPAWRVVARAAADLAITIPMQYLEVNMRRAPSHLVPLTHVAIAAAGLLLAIVGGTNAATVLIGLGITLGAGTIGVLAWRRSAPGETTVTANWWKYLIAGPSLVAAVMLAAGAGVEAWFLGMACVLTAFVLTAVGLLLGVTHLVIRRS